MDFKIFHKKTVKTNLLNMHNKFVKKYIIIAKSTINS